MKNTFRNNTIFILVVGFVLRILIFFPSAPFAQEEKIELNSSYQLYSEIEKNFTEFLPEMQREIETVLKSLKTKDQDLSSLKLKLSQIESLLTRIRYNQNFSAITNTLDKILDSISDGEKFLKERKPQKAKNSLRQSVIYLKVLSESPVLKMSEAQIDLDQADQQRLKRDYQASQVSLEKAISHIQGLLVIESPKIATQMNQIKNDIVLLHQQIILGKHVEELQERSIWKRMQQMQVESLAHYYDLWSQTYHPWDRE